MPQDGRMLSEDAGPRVDLIKQRFAAVLQRVKRNRLFVAPVAARGAGAGTEGAGYYQLSNLASLKGSKGPKVVLGMLHTMPTGGFVLEDLSTRVRADVSQARLSNGLFTETSVLVAEGEWRNDMFVVSVIGGAPFESREQSRIMTPTVDAFHGLLDDTTRELMVAREVEMEDQHIVMLSDVWLDVPAVVERLAGLLNSYNQQPTEALPAVILLMGSFFSREYGRGSEDDQIVTECFDRLGNLLASFERVVAATRVVMVPDRQDPRATAVVPRGPIPDEFTGGLREAVPGIEMASNPTRIRLYSREVVVL